MDDYLNRVLEILNKIQGSLQTQLEITKLSITDIKNMHREAQDNLFKITNNILKEIKPAGFLETKPVVCLETKPTDFLEPNIKLDNDIN